MTILCRYRYDPLNRLAHCEPAAQPSTQQFYLKNRLAVEIQGQAQRRLIQHDDLLLAQWRGEGGSSSTALLVTDQQRSVLHVLDATQQQTFAYSPYGFRQPQPGWPGFNGEQPDPVTGHYLLGNGYRTFNPVLMRFNSPDSLSPFGEGGLNAYAYCGGDPINRVDPTGHTWAWVKVILRAFNVMNKTPVAPRLNALIKKGSLPPTSSVGLKPVAALKSADPPHPSRFFGDLPQPENVPAHLQTTRRRLPDLPVDSKQTPMRPHNIYHMPKGVARPIRRFETPTSKPQSIFSNLEKLMELIYEDPIPLRISSQQEASASIIINRGKEISEKIRAT